MNLFPLNLNISGKKAVLIGGGAVAARKCVQLLDAGAIVTVVAPRLASTLAVLVEDGLILHEPRVFSPGDLADAFLAFAMTDDHEVNLAVAREARQRNILVSLSDAPGSGDFTMPAVVRRGRLQITVSTGGASPAMAKRVRQQLEESFDDAYAQSLELLALLREKLLTEKKDSAYNNKLLNDLVDHDLPRLFRESAAGEIDRLLTDLFGPEFSLAALGERGKENSQ